MNEDPLAEAKRKLKEINGIISTLDPAVRLAAFELLVPLHFASESEVPASHGAKRKTASKPAVESGDRESFFTGLPTEKPADNVNQIAAWIYSQHGVVEISKKMVVEMANEVGLTIPDRPDNTMRTAKKGGKALYRQRNSGWQLTVHGETHVKTTYNVRKGNKPLPDTET
jgi:hypothetical protein